VLVTASLDVHPDQSPSAESRSSAGSSISWVPTPLAQWKHRSQQAHPSLAPLWSSVGRTPVEPVSYDRRYALPYRSGSVM
jgi:hypothetical protein